MVVDLIDSESKSIRTFFPDISDNEKSKPSKHFYLLFGLCIENIAADDKRNVLFLLECIRKMIHASVTGPSFLAYSHAAELLQILDRTSQSNNISIENVTLIILQQIILEYGDKFILLREDGFDIEETKPMASKSLKIVCNVLINYVPIMLGSRKPSVLPRKASSLSVLPILKSLELLSLLIRNSVKDSQGIFFHVICVIFCDKSWAKELNSKALPIFKDTLEYIGIEFDRLQTFVCIILDFFVALLYGMANG